MLPKDASSWTDRFRRTLGRYDEPLLRRVAGQLVRPRTEWPAPELIERCVTATTNAAVVDRRLQALDPASRRLLAFLAHSGQLSWRLGCLLELLAAVGHAEGPRPAFSLFEAGLLYPDLPERVARLESFEQWLGQAGSTAFTVITHPLVAARAASTDLGLPSLKENKETRRPGDKETGGVSLSPQEADGLEWPLRLAVLWQRVAEAPLRRTQQGDFFKRDLDRLRADPLLSGPSGGAPAPLPDLALLAVALGQALGLIEEADGELRAAAAPTLPGERLAETTAAL